MEKVIPEDAAGSLPAIQIDGESTKVYEPLALTCKFPMDTELVLQCQRLGHGVFKGTPIGKVIELWPVDALKREVLKHTKTFVRHMKAQGYIAQEPETEMELWGPFRERLDMAKADNLINFEEGNPFIPEGHKGPPSSSWQHDLKHGPLALDRQTLREHRDWQRGVVFMVRGKFLATRGHQADSTGTLIV